MGCGCKTNKKDDLPIDKTDLNIYGKLLKLPTAIILTLFTVIFSPIILIIVWWLLMMNIFGKNGNLVNLILLNFNKNKPLEEDSDETFDEEDYELMDVEVIK